MSSPEMYMAEEGAISLPLLIDKDDAAEFDKWLRLRKQYVDRQGWRTENPNSDRDRYDDDTKTRHLIMKSNEKIITGLRLTPCDKVEETLSWSMLSDHMRQLALDNMPDDFDNKKLFDLTRLVAVESQSPRQMVDAILELFGAAMAYSLQDDENYPLRQPRWIFTTSLPFLHLLKRQGIEFIEITRDVINPGDHYKSVFCYVDPLEQLQKLHDKNAVYEHSLDFITQGIKAATNVEVT